jgi:hypothetical protein
MRRQVLGATKGIKPSNTKTSASAGQNTSASDVPTQRGTLLLRMALKKSDEGSITITSDLPAKLAL